METGHSRYKGLFKISVFLRDLLKGTAKGHTRLEIRGPHCCFMHGNCLKTYNLVSGTKSTFTAIFFTMNTILGPPL